MPDGCGGRCGMCCCSTGLLAAGRRHLGLPDAFGWVMWLFAIGCAVARRRGSGGACRSAVAGWLGGLALSAFQIGNGGDGRAATDPAARGPGARAVAGGAEDQLVGRDLPYGRLFHWSGSILVGAARLAGGRCGRDEGGCAGLTARDRPERGGGAAAISDAVGLFRSRWSRPGPRPPAPASRAGCRAGSSGRQDDRATGPRRGARRLA